LPLRGDNQLSPNNNGEDALAIAERHATYQHPGNTSPWIAERLRQLRRDGR
jgi:hypothetical protein